MTVKKKTSLLPLLGWLAISTIAAAGCRTTGFDKPNLDVLKFWKSNETVETKTPPPPARYFDPAPILEEQVADASTSVNQTIDLNSQRFNDQLNRSIAQTTDNVKANINSFDKTASLDNLRQPLTNAQQDFQSAMQGAVDASSQTAAKVVDSPAAQQWNDFELPANMKLENQQPRLNQSLAGLKKSIYDANGKLVDTKQDVKDSIMERLDQTKSSFPVATKLPEAIKAATTKPP